LVVVCRVEPGYNSQYSRSQQCFYYVPVPGGSSSW
jgi:hypothetical protein